MTRANPTATEQCAELKREVAALRAAIAAMAYYVSPHAPIPMNVSPELDAIRLEFAGRIGREVETRPAARAPERRKAAV